jgi:hypothetical protein
MDDKAREMDVERRLQRFGLHWHSEDRVEFSDIAPDPNPARWETRYDEKHKEEIAMAICNGGAVPALLLYKPPGATRYRPLGGRHRMEAAQGLGETGWPAYVIDEPLDEFLLEALPIYDNVGAKKAYTRQQRLEFAAHLYAFKDRDPTKIAAELQLKPNEVTQHIELLAAMNRAHDLAIPSDTLQALDPKILISANKSLPLALVFKATVETLAFTELQYTLAKSLINNAANAESETEALAVLREIYEKHKAELERRKNGGKRNGQTLAQKIKTPMERVEKLWPGRIELLEINAHNTEFISQLEHAARKAREVADEVIQRCLQVISMRAQSAGLSPPGSGAVH